MYPHFIQVHDVAGHEGLLNIDHIVSVCENQITLSNMPNGKGNEGALAVRESYDELKALIIGSGCLINKGDPRLDNKPLTMEDLQNMVGQPVWNANLSRWHLVENTEPDEYRGSVVILKGTHSQVWYYDSADLIRHPLYRMKEAE